MARTRPSRRSQRAMAIPISQSFSGVRMATGDAREPVLRGPRSCRRARARARSEGSAQPPHSRPEVSHENIIDVNFRARPRRHSLSRRRTGRRPGREHARHDGVRASHRGPGQRLDRGADHARGSGRAARGDEHRPHPHRGHRGERALPHDRQAQPRAAGHGRRDRSAAGEHPGRAHRHHRARQPGDRQLARRHPLLAGDLPGGAARHGGQPQGPGVHAHLHAG